MVLLIYVEILIILMSLINNWENYSILSLWINMEIVIYFKILLAQIQYNKDEFYSAHSCYS